LLLNFLSNYDWPCAHSINTAEAAADSFTNVILQTTDFAIPRAFIKKSKSSHLQQEFQVLE